MGADRPRAAATERVRALRRPTLKPPPDRLYGRTRGHPLRPRQRLLLDRALPRLCLDAGAAGDPVAAFPRRPARLGLEVGFGGGEHAVAQVRSDPDAGLIACEVFENGLCALLSHLLPEPADPAAAPLPPNLLVWPDDARALLPLLPEACLDAVFLLFPDPWPKVRHAKRRFVHPALVPLVARVMKPAAPWRVATDDLTYQAWVAEVMHDQALFSVPTPARVRPPGWPPTRYEAKALAAGRTPLYWSFERL